MSSCRDIRADRQDDRRTDSGVRHAGRNTSHPSPGGEPSNKIDMTNHVTVCILAVPFLHVAFSLF